MSADSQSVSNAASYHQQTELEQAGLLPDLNGVDLAMSFSPKLQQQHHIQNQANNSHTTPFSVTDILSPIEENYRKLELAAAAAAHAQQQQGGSPYGAGNQVCRVSNSGGGNATGSSSATSGSPPLHGGSTPGVSTPGPIIGGANGCTSSSGGGLGGGHGNMSTMSNPYATMQLAPQYQYCAAELSPYHHAGAGVGGGGSAGDPMRSHAVSTHHPWYAPAPPTTNDPRFASE